MQHPIACRVETNTPHTTSKSGYACNTSSILVAAMDVAWSLAGQMRYIPKQEPLLSRKFEDASEEKLVFEASLVRRGRREAQT